MCAEESKLLKDRLSDVPLSGMGFRAVLDGAQADFSQ